MSHTLCTFNANNLYARYRFGEIFPGDRTGASRAPPGWGYLPPYDENIIELFNFEQRQLAAWAITGKNQRWPDVLCLQEVESLIALREFNKEHLGGKYPYALLIDSRDYRQIDVGVLSRLEILSVRSHVDDRDPEPESAKKPWLFSRDCLEVEVALNKSGSKRLFLFINHFKSKYAETAAERQKADALRRRQARAVKDIVHARFPGAEFGKALFAVAGDLNDEPGSMTVRPLVQQSGLADALARIPREEERWTHWYRSENTVSQLDYLLLSPALDAATAGTPPRIERRGIGFSRILADGKPGPKITHFHRRDEDPDPMDISFRFERFAGVSTKTYASDHCPIFLEVP